MSSGSKTKAAKPSNGATAEVEAPEGGTAVLDEMKPSDTVAVRYRLWSSKDCPQQNPMVRVGRTLYEFPYETDPVEVDPVTGEDVMDGDEQKRLRFRGRVYTITPQEAKAIRDAADAPIVRGENGKLISGIPLERDPETPIGKYLHIQPDTGSDMSTSVAPELLEVQLALYQARDVLDSLDPFEDEHEWRAAKRKVDRLKERYTQLEAQG